MSKNIVVGYGSLLKGLNDYQWKKGRKYCYGYVNNCQRTVIPNDTRFTDSPITTVNGLPVRHKLYAGVEKVLNSQIIAIFFEVEDIDAYDKREFLYKREKLSIKPSAEEMYVDVDSLTDTNFLTDKDDVWIYIPKRLDSNLLKEILQRQDTYMDREYYYNIEYTLRAIQLEYGLKEKGKPFNCDFRIADLLYPHDSLKIVINDPSKLRVDLENQRLMYEDITIPLGSVLIVNNPAEASSVQAQIAEFNKLIPEAYRPSKGYSVRFSREHILY